MIRPPPPSLDLRNHATVLLTDLNCKSDNPETQFMGEIATAQVGHRTAAR